MQVVTLEEHYYDPDVAALYNEPIPGGSPRGGGAVLTRQRLDDVGALRISEMDAAGIDMQVISHGAPGLQRVNAETAIQLAARANDRLAEAVEAHAGRFAGFALLPVPDPEAAAEELERAVSKLGFKGAMVHGLTEGQFLDDRRFWPIYERAAALDVPVYVHPAAPHQDVARLYYGDYAKEFPSILSAAWGFTVETATQGIRLVLSGMFDEYPNLKMILGHMGEGLPFLLQRIDEAFSRPGNKANTFRKTFAEHFYITTSGNFSTPALICSMLEMGIDHILYSVDYPFVENAPGTEWLKTVPLSDADREKLFGGNAKRLLKL
jgi:2,3-dihydroxybenzoate decarboxylase